MLTATTLLKWKPANLLANDTLSLAAVAVCNVALVVAEFTPEENLVAGDLTYATFDGGDALEVGATGGLWGIDPLTGDILLTVKDPVGGWRWRVGDPGDPYQTVWGYALLNNDSTVLWGSELLPEPLAMNFTLREVLVGSVGFRFPAGYLNG